MTDDADALRDAPPARLDVPICRDFGSPQQFRAESDPPPDETLDSGDGSPGTMFGHFSTFDDWYEIDSFWEGNFLESIAPGAFKRTIKNRSGESPVRVLLDHGFDPQLGDKPLGVPDILEERDPGPYAEVPLFRGVPDLVVSGLAAGAYGQSFRFRVLRDEWNEEPDPSDYNPKGVPERTIKEVRLIEFGPTPFPANPSADAGLRSSTDRYYESLSRKNPAAVEQALARTLELRSAKVAPGPGPGDDDAPPAPAPTPVKRTVPVRSKPAKSDDSPKPHPKDPPETGHSDGPPAERHSEATNPSTEGKAMADETMTATERAARQDEISARLGEIDTEYNGAELPEDTQTEWDDLSAEYERHEAAIAADTLRKKRIAEIAKRQEGERAQPHNRPTERTRPDNIYDLAGIRQAARSIDELPGLYRENAYRAIDEARFHLPVERGIKREDAQEQLRYLLDYVDDENGKIARRILVTGSPLYQRAFGKYCITQGTMTLSTEEQRALAVGAGGTGGFAVPFQLDPTLILTQAGSVNPFRRIARVEQITGKEWDGLTTTGIVVSRAAEAAQASDNAPTLLQPTVKAERVQGFVPFSIEADQDWGALQAQMTRLLADAKDQEEASSFLLGNGVSPNANGLLDSTAGIVGASDVVANTITAAAPYALENALPVRYRNQNTRFMAAKAIYNAIRQLDTAGGAQMWERIGAGMPSLLLGYPAEENSNMPSNPTPALNDRWMVFGDFQQFLIVDRVGMQVDLIPHLFGANQRPTGQRGIYALWRNNSKVLISDAFRVAKRTT